MSRVLDSVVRDALLELADENYQARVWSASTGPEIGSLTEAIERLLDDSGLGDALEKNDGVYQPETDSILRELAGLLVQLDDVKSPAMVLRDTRILEVRRLAAAALEDSALGGPAGTGSS